MQFEASFDQTMGLRPFFTFSSLQIQWSYYNHRIWSIALRKILVCIVRMLVRACANIMRTRCFKPYNPFGYTPKNTPMKENIILRWVGRRGWLPAYTFADKNLHTRQNFNQYLHFWQFSKINFHFNCQLSIFLFFVSAHTNARLEYN